jgi:tetratricopeptide (TPR) repeat protein
MAINVPFQALSLGVVVVVLSGCAGPTPTRAPSARPAKSAAAGGDPLSPDARAQAHAQFMAGVIHQLNDRPDAALEALGAAALADAGNEALVLDVSRRYLMRKQPEKALELLRKASAQPGASGAIFARLGMIQAQLGQAEAATKSNQLAIKKSPRQIAGYHNLFVGHLQANQPEAARKVLEWAARQGGDDAEFLIQLAELQAAFGRQFPAEKEASQAAALETLQRAARLESAHPALQLKLADGFATLGDTNRALRLYQDLLAEPGDLPIVRDAARAKLTELYLRGRDHEHALEQLEAIVREDPANAQAYFHLGSLAFEQKQFERAADNFQKTVLLAPNFQQAYFDLAGAQINLGRVEDALATLGRARTNFSASFVLEFLTGMAHSRQKNYPQAVQHFTAAEIIGRAGETNRLNEFFYFQMGAAFERAGDHAQAERGFEEALARAPDFAEALNYLGYMWAERGVQPGARARDD